ncbi:restriction endonuclease [Chryseobacterium sp. JV558]|uniref:restriction endonuclease n=1 Tax=Chryseobacterium sp. JV558 TaxID=2663236 RepID=UPI00299E3BEE|nr:restriction endonuclease [Chryseobacterium sp. JV558]MDW9379510.1 hypothetical protein [Chryseobacterium sp. JV558]
MKAGKEYELLIANMYRSLEPNAEVTHDDQIYDDRAKITRQIDVSIKYKFAGTDHLIIVQAKDYKIKANISVVDQFQTVIADTKANKGILICSNGFTESALVKAKSYGIDCLTVHSALNKKWETLLKIPVKKVVHEFSFYSKVLYAIPDEFDEKSTIIADVYSYDGINIVYGRDIIMDNIINKMGWDYIKKIKKININLKKLGMFQYIAEKMVPITEGFIEINYEGSKVLNFYVDPANYIYSNDHISGDKVLHNLTITQKTLDDLMEDRHVNDKSITDSPIISASLYNFKDGGGSTLEISFNVKGGIEGDFLIKGNRILSNDKWENYIIELENNLNIKNQQK